MDTCEKSYAGRLTKNMMCAGFKKGGIDTCQVNEKVNFVAKSSMTQINNIGLGARLVHPICNQAFKENS